MDFVTFVVVVNNFDKLNNVFLKGVGVDRKNVIVCDNTKENVPLTKHYNDVIIKSLEDQGSEWFVFCHQDFYLGEDISIRLKNLDRHYIYGAIGLNSERRFIGKILHGENVPVGDDPSKNDIVETVDGMCIIVNKETIIERNLLFDESFRFHMYSEDFSYSAIAKGILTKILQMNVHHKCIVSPKYLNDPEYVTSRALAVKKWGLIRSTTGVWS